MARRLQRPLISVTPMLSVIGLAVVLAVFVGSGAAASADEPKNTDPPTISGTAQEGKTLTGDRGDWKNDPTDYDYAWLRCNRDGGGCSSIEDADSREYTLKAADVGHSIRFRVEARNSDGRRTATSVPTAVIVAAASKVPVSTSPPVVSGTLQAGKTLTASRGNWDNNPTDYAYAWLRCDKNGGSCASIGGATSTRYTLTSADVGATIRFRVQAKNGAGTATATSVPSAVVTGAAPPAPPIKNGCPSTGTDQVSAISQPARLLIDSLQPVPRVVTAGTGTLVVRFHVTSTCGGPVQGALVYATATPYNQFAIPPEVTTDSGGWAEVHFRRLSGFPVSRHQQLIAMFVRARKPGENLLGGISTRRLVSIRVALGR